MTMDDSALLSRVIDLAAEKLADRAEARLSPAELAALEERAIQRRIGRLSLEEAVRHLRQLNRACLRDYCARRRIPIRGTRKQPFILLADIEAADALSAAPSLPQTQTTTADR